jgi:hypothetical protein
MNLDKGWKDSQAIKLLKPLAQAYGFLSRTEKNLMRNALTRPEPDVVAICELLRPNLEGDL